MIAIISPACAPVTTPHPLPSSYVFASVALYVQLTGEGVAVDALRQSACPHNQYVPGMAVPW